MDLTHLGYRVPPADDTDSALSISYNQSDNEVTLTVGRNTLSIPPEKIDTVRLLLKAVKEQITDVRE